MKTITKIVASSLLVLGLSACDSTEEEQDGPAAITPEPGATITQTLDRYLEQNQSPEAAGVAVLVRRRGQVVYINGRGVLDVSKAQETGIQNSSLFRIGSLAMPMTAVAVMQLVEDDLLQLNDRIRDHLPNLPRAYDAITVEQLLAHRSGLPDFLDEPSAILRTYDGLDNDALLRRRADIDDLDFTPGRRSELSHSNYLLLAEIVEQVSGLYFPDYMQANIFSRVGMFNTYVANPRREIGALGETVALNNGREQTVLGLDLQSFGPYGIVSSVADINLFVQALRLNQLISAQTLANMSRPRGGLAEVADYALGWYTGTGDYDNVGRYVDAGDIWHIGRLDGFRSIMAISRSNDLDVVVLGNGGNASERHGFNILETVRRFYR